MIVTIRNDRFTTVKTTLRPSDGDRYVTFSGRLDQRRILRLDREYSLNIRSETEIALLSHSVGVTVAVDEGIPCEVVFPPGGVEVQSLLTIPNSLLSNQLPEKEMAPDLLVANLYSQAGKVFQTQDRIWPSRFFERSVADLLRKALIEAESTEEGFSGDLLLDFAQDMKIRNFLIKPATYENGAARVTVSWDNFDVGNSMVYLLVRDADGWKIRDIRHDSGRESILDIFR